MEKDQKDKLRQNITFSTAREEKCREMLKAGPVETWSATHKPYSAKRIEEE